MSVSDNEDDDLQLTPPEILEAAPNLRLDTLPLKSQKTYWRTYDTFNQWRLDKKLKISANTMLAYFGEIAKSYKPSTLWSKYSMLRTTVENKHVVKLEDYRDLVNFLKSKSKGYVAKKSKVLSADNVKKFLNDAPDETYLAKKVALIFGIYGAYRHGELVNINLSDVKDLGEVIKITLNDTKNKTSRQFIIEGEHSILIKKYMTVRPRNGTVDRFFLTYKDGKCINQPIGKNKIGKMPFEIAGYLKLPDPEQYTGHSFRRSSATICAEEGIQMDDLKRFAGWKSTAVAEGYIAESVDYKRKTSKVISNVLGETSHDSESAIIEQERKKPRLEVGNTEANTRIQNFSAMSSYEDKVSLIISNCNNININFHN